jgi:hypothetical protein
MIWRRFLIRSDSTLTDLHNTLQIAFGWSDFHLHRSGEPPGGLKSVAELLRLLEVVLCFGVARPIGHCE